MVCLSCEHYNVIVDYPPLEELTGINPPQTDACYGLPIKCAAESLQGWYSVKGLPSSNTLRIQLGGRATRRTRTLK